MTSELKPCPFCLRPLKRSSGKFNPMAVCETDGCWMKEKQIAVPCDDPFSVKSWNTRAVPDVPELVRYRLNQMGELVYSENGQYVLHSQAAEIIAADRAEKHRAQEAVLKLERELAQYKDQIPIGYITPKAQLSLLQEFSASDSISPVKMGECRVAIYDRPAPAADLKTEMERLREVIENSGCPRPCNSWSDDTTVKECISYGECACVYGTVLNPSELKND